MSRDDPAPPLRAPADEARRLEPCVVRGPTRTSADYKTVLIIETAGLAASHPQAVAHPP